MVELVPQFQYWASEDPRKPLLRSGDIMQVVLA